MYWSVPSIMVRQFELSEIWHTVSKWQAKLAGQAPLGRVQRVKRPDRYKNPIMAAHPSSRTRPYRLSNSLKGDIQRWSRLWGLPDLSQEVTVRFNGRLRITVARLLSGVDVIEVGPRFIALRSKRREILCHELAHAAASRRPRGGLPPHGAEWAALVQSAGFDPVSRLTVPRRVSPSTLSRNVRYEHRCLVCQFVRVARRSVHSWRCAECVRCGLPGKLTISVLNGRRSAR